MDLLLHVASCLLDTDVRDPVAQGDGLLGEGKAEGLTTYHARDRRDITRLGVTEATHSRLYVRLGIDIDTGGVLELLVAEDGLARSYQFAILSREDEVASSRLPLIVEAVDSTPV